ncbi:MAG: hypothetical protein ACP5XB_11525 [Isosphaeraceae bacterium]
MASEPVPSVQIEPRHTLGMNLVGTVALPSPFPAAARIFVVRHPAPKGAKGEKGKPIYHLKIVQELNDGHSITRLVALEHVRLVRFNQPTESVPSPADANEAPLPAALENDDLRKEIEAVPWEKAVKEGRGAYEVELYPGRLGVVHVHEQTPVLTRHECIQTAAMSIQRVLGPRQFCPHCCCPPSP